MILAILNIARHGGQWDSIPFVNPILWLDWVALYGFFGLIWPVLSLASAVIGAGIWIMSLWLVIGYSRDYGTLQYDVLNIPSLCNQDVPYQTDPRRLAFLIMHQTYFFIATIGFFFLLFILHKRSHGEEGPVPNYLKVVLVVICFILPAIAGIILAAVMHSHLYLILLHHGCYGSFVSGTFGYLNLYTIPRLVRITTIIGVNV